MKKIFVVLSVVLLPLLCNAQQDASPTAPRIGCIDKDIALRVEDVKHDLLEKGMHVYKDAMVTMESEIPYSIEVKLERGHRYRMIYMGSDISSRSSIELYDGDDQLITKKALSRGEQPGYITFDQIPVKTDVYLVVLLQKQKHAEMCGSFTILEDQSK